MPLAYDKPQPRLHGPCELEEGVCYLVQGKSVEPSYRLFQHLTDDGVPGLCVSRVHPDRLRAKYGLAHVRMGWISHSPGDDNYDPTAIGTLANAIRDFIDRHPDGSVVMLDGVEYIMANLGFTKTLFFVEHLNEFVMPRRATILLPVDPQCFEATEFARLERFMEGIGEEDLRDALDAPEEDRNLLAG